MSPLAIVPYDKQRVIADLRAERAANPNKWCLIKHKIDPDKHCEADKWPDACTILGFGKTTVEKLIKSEQIFAEKLVGGAVRVRIDSIYAWMIARIEAGDLKTDGRRLHLDQERGNAVAANKAKAAQAAKRAAKRAKRPDGAAP